MGVPIDKYNAALEGAIERVTRAYKYSSGQDEIGYPVNTAEARAQLSGILMALMRLRYKVDEDE